MQAFMNIQVRVLSRAAQGQVKALQAQVAALQGQLAATNATASAGGGLGGRKYTQQLAKWGNQVQWTGRQLQYNWTLPLAVAAGAAVKWQLDTERAMTQVTKVYGSTQRAAAYFMRTQEGLTREMAQNKAARVFAEELDALGEAFTALSSHYGVARTEVLDTAAAWASAGQSGIALAKSTELSLRTAILGDIDLAKATESLIAIQAQYSLNTRELTVALAELNAIENETGIRTAGLIDGFARTAGVAREAGIDVRHLGAMMAALVPAAGTASNAGNALKTIISRLMSPTEEASQVMNEMGLAVESAAWQGMTALERMQMASEAFSDGLSDSQKQVAATVLGSRWQLNKFLILMRELGPEVGFYERALKATANTTNALRTAENELNKVLDSSPKRLDIIWYSLQNGMADAIQPMIPYILWLLDSVRQLVEGFNSLDPSMQKFILISLLALAAIGPIVRYVGTLATLVGTLGHAFAWAGAKMGLLLFGLEKTDEGLRSTRAGIFKTIATWLAWPFRTIASGFGAMFAKIFMWFRFWPIVAISSATAVIRAFALITVLPRIIATTGAAMIASWKATWFAIKGIMLVTLAQIRVIQVGAAVFEIGLWTRTRAILTAIHAGLSTVILRIWTAMHASMLLISRASFGGLIALTSKAGALLVKGLTNPYVLAGIAIIGLLVAFRKQIAQIWDNIVEYFADSNNGLVEGIMKAWNLLPASVSNALVAVAQVVHDAAMQIYEWFSYINPFARHSPSLVENVTNGMAAVRAEFAKTSSIGNNLKGAYRDILAFGTAVRQLTGGAASFKQAQDRAQIKKFAPGALDEYDQLNNRLASVTQNLGRMAEKVRAQEAVVTRWEKSLDAANEALDRQQNKLQRLQGVADRWSSKLDEAQQRLSMFASAPIKGMGAMEDKIFENEMAQKRLRLEMMKMEDAGQTLDDVRNKLALLNGEQEMLTGRRNDLRGAGAGSEITSVYDAQIKAVEKQKKALAQTAAPLQKMQDEIDKLARKGEMLDLQKALKFDPLTRAIDKAANAMKELPFDKIMSGIRGAQADIDKYSAKVEEANKAVERQQKVVDAATAARDRASTRLDREQTQLDGLKDKYQAIEDVIRDIESAMSDVATAADTMQRALDDKKQGRKDRKSSEYITPGLKNFRAAEGGNFTQVGGSGIPDRKNWSSQADQIKKFTSDLGMQTGKLFGDLDPFAPIKEKWQAFKSWMSKTWDALWTGIKDFFTHAFEGVNFGPAKQKISGFGDWLSKTWDKIWGGLKSLGKLFLPDVKRIWNSLKNIVGDAVDSIWPELKKFKDLFEPIKGMVMDLWPGIKGLAMIIGGALLLAFKIAAGVISNVFGPVFEMIFDVIGDVIKIIRGLIEFVVGVFTLDWKMAWKGIKDIVGGTFEAIWDILKGATKIVQGIIKGFVMGIYEFFVWLWDVLVGHSVVPDMIDGIVKVFKTLVTLPKWIWQHVLKPIYDFFVSLWKNYVHPAIKLWWSGITATWNGLKDLGKWVWDHVLKPVLDWFKTVWDRVKSELKQWWENIKLTWSMLKQLGQWVWDNVLKPIKDRITGLWTDHLRPYLLSWPDKFKNAWSNLKALGGWIWDHVLVPIKQKFVDIWHAIRDWFVENGGIIIKPIKGVVNMVIDSINAMIRGLNKIADVLPGLDWSISLIPQLAQGGQIPGKRVGAGFMTNGARAIVGEGNTNHPEFVVPTDPRHRKRAGELYAQLGQRLGVMDFPSKFANGGVLPANAGGLGDMIGSAIGSAKNLVKDGYEWIKGNVEKLASTPFNFFKNMAQGYISKIEWKYGRQTAQWALDQVMNWVSKADRQYAEKAGAVMPPVVGNRPTSPGGWTNPMGGPYSVGGSLGSYPGHTGLDLPAAIGTAVRAIHSGIVTGSYDLPGSNAYNSTPYRSYGRLVTLDHQNGYTSLYAHLSQRIAQQGQHVAAGSLLGLVGMNGNATGPHLHLEVRRGGALLEPRSFLSSVGVPLASGGIIRRRAGGILARIGEGNRDEAVTPLPRNWRSEGIGHSGGSGDTYINVNGDLSFPNIDTAEDAEVFIANLKSLAGGAA